MAVEYKNQDQVSPNVRSNMEPTTVALIAIGALVFVCIAPMIFMTLFGKKILKGMFDTLENIDKESKK